MGALALLLSRRPKVIQLAMDPRVGPTSCQEVRLLRRQL